MPFPSAPPLTLHRPGESFTSAELQVMAAEGLLRRVLWDTYVEAHHEDTAAVRATAIWQTMAAPLKNHGVLCGQTAAWVHGVGPAPARIHLITPGFFRRQQVGSTWWSIHQVPLTDHETTTYSGVPVTAPARTAIDLFCGVGAPDSRKRLDQAGATTADTLNHLSHWPAVKEPLRERDECVSELSAGDVTPVQLRSALIGALVRLLGRGHFEAVTRGILERAHRLNTADVQDLLDQCVSRRLPTVR